MTVNMQVFGMSKLNAALKTVTFRKAAQYHDGLNAACNFILERSREIVPYDTGYLHSTGYTSINGRGFFATGEVGYSAYYAMIVHEKVWANFKNGKQAKYLESTIERYQMEIAALIRNPMERV